MFPRYKRCHHHWKATADPLLNAAHAAMSLIVIYASGKGTRIDRTLLFCGGGGAPIRGDWQEGSFALTLWILRTPASYWMSISIITVSAITTTTVGVMYNSTVVKETEGSQLKIVVWGAVPFCMYEYLKRCVHLHHNFRHPRIFTR